MSSERLRPNQAGPLTEFTFAIIGAFVVGLPMALGIIWLLK
jgi:hypothetical protein